MGNQKLKWTAEEEEALLAGIAKHGPGKWKNILTDPEFAPSLTHRSNIDLKDKWRNLCVNNGGPGSKDKSRTSKGKIKALPPPDNAENSVTADGSGDAVMSDPSINEVKVRNAPRYNAMIFDALSTIKDVNGCDTSAIVHFVERNYLVPPNIRRVLGTRLRKLVSQGKLEKVQSRYRIRKDTLLGTRSPISKQKDIRPQKLHNPRLASGETVVGAAPSVASKVTEAGKDILLGSRTPIPKQKHIRLQQLQNPRLTSGETLERAATSAASKIAEAENKSYLAADKVKEAERLSKMAEENDTMLQLVKEIYEQCLRGEIFLSA